MPHAPALQPRFQHVTPSFRTFCGEDALSALPRELDRADASRAVIICAPWVRDHPHVLATIEKALGARLAGCFDGVEDHSPVPVVEEARQSLEQARADAVIAVGGGSVIVTARAATILLAERRPVRDLCTRREADGRLASPRLAAPKIPNWVVPTTPITAYAKAGSAVRDPDTGERLALFDPKTRAQGIFLDPAMALTAPVGLASSAALNAFAMAVESLQACPDDPLAEALLVHTLRCSPSGSRGWAVRPMILSPGCGLCSRPCCAARAATSSAEAWRRRCRTRPARGPRSPTG
jgi:alcohol dehydrogenase class IV